MLVAKQTQTLNSSTVPAKPGYPFIHPCSHTFTIKITDTGSFIKKENHSNHPPRRATEEGLEKGMYCWDWKRSVTLVRSYILAIHSTRTEFTQEMNAMPLPPSPPIARRKKMFKSFLKSTVHWHSHTPSISPMERFHKRTQNNAVEGTPASEGD